MHVKYELLYKYEFNRRQAVIELSKQLISAYHAKHRPDCDYF